MKTKEKPILTFQVISDTEVIAAAPEDDCNKQFDAALSAVEREAPESKAIFICGDILNRGRQLDLFKQNNKRSHCSQNIQNTRQP